MFRKEVTADHRVEEAASTEGSRPSMGLRATNVKMLMCQLPHSFGGCAIFWSRYLRKLRGVICFGLSAGVKLSSRVRAVSSWSCLSFDVWKY